jgi:outer membrane protein OmpA-like peptidoglycan-associated protein
MQKTTLLALGTAFGSMMFAGSALAADANGMGQSNQSTQSSTHTTGPASWYVAPMAVGTSDDAERRTDFGVGGTLRIGKILTDHFNLELALSGSHFFKRSTGGNSWDTFSAGLHGLYFFTRTSHFSPFVDVGAGFVRSRVKGHSPASTAQGVTPGERTYYHSDPVFNADLGAKIPLNDYGMKLRIEGGYQWTVYGHREGPGSDHYIFAEPQGMIGLEIPLGSQKETQVAQVKDSDHDGVPDSKDQCPNTPEGVTVDAKGCALDSDNDGVPDYKDQCPNTPEGVQVNEKGCALDSDHDGVPDYKDQCPNTPEGVQVNAKGCHVKAHRVLHKVHFAFDKAELTNTDKKILRDEASQLKDAFNQYSGAHALIIGYTDSTGAKSYNQKLSQRRADSVRTYLINQGVSSSKLRTRGMGEADPVASNKTRTGRAENRRVVVHVLKAGATQ